MLDLSRFPGKVLKISSGRHQPQIGALSHPAADAGWRLLLLGSQGENLIS